MSAEGQAIGHREIMDITAAANYLGVSRSHLSHILAGRIPGVPPIPHGFHETQEISKRKLAASQARK
jgi:hypothetical protein